MNQALRLSFLSLVSCFGVSALLMSSALAQVNGPGASPSSLFDTVLNLPGDEAVITGAKGESVGGTPGLTTQLNVASGGTVGQIFNAGSGSEVNIAGGAVGGFFRAVAGSEINFSGGILGRNFSANSGSQVNITGGTVGNRFDARFGGEVNISGGAVGIAFDAQPGSDVELIGGEFRLNGADYSANTITLAGDDVFTGTLADGSSFIFSESAFDRLTDVELTLVSLPTADLSPTIVNNPIISGLSGLRSNQTLTLVTGGSLRDNFAVVDATLNVEGGIMGNEGEAFNSLVNISNGTVGQDWSVHDSEMNISGGAVGDFLRASKNSVINISGGTVGDSFRVFNGNVVISGGSVGNSFNAFDGSEVNILGTEFFIDGLELDALQPREAFTIPNRNVTLSGTLADGEQFSFDLNSTEQIGFDFFDPDATITVTLTPALLLGDVNFDGVVDFFDIAPFIERLSSQTFQIEADIDGNGVVDFFDIQPFIDILSGQ